MHALDRGQVKVGSINFSKSSVLLRLYCSLEDVLRHWPYIELLPDSSKLFTPLFFTISEQQAFVGTNMHSAMVERYNAWQIEWKHCQAFISAKRVEWGEQFTW